MGRNNFEGETGKPYRDTVRSSVQTRLNRSRCRFGCGLAWAQSIMCYMGGPNPWSERAILVDKGAQATRHCVRWRLSSPSPQRKGGGWKQPRHFSADVLCRKLCKNGWTDPLAVGLWTRVDRRMHKFNRIHQVAPMCPHGRTRCCHLSNNIEPDNILGVPLRGEAPYGKLLWPLIIFGHTPTYTVAQTAKRFEPSNVLWAFHTIQSSSSYWLAGLGIA